MRRLLWIVPLVAIVAGCLWAAFHPRLDQTSVVQTVQAPPRAAPAPVTVAPAAQPRGQPGARPPPEASEAFYRDFQKWQRERAAPAPRPELPSPPVTAQPGEPNPMLVPIGARPYQRMMLREARLGWGMSAPTAMFGAQVQTESGWHPTAHSPYAAGLAQFIPATAHAMSAKYPDQLGADDPLSPQWALRALVMYDRDLWRAVHGSVEGCDRWAFTLSAYNGGPGWIPRDRGLCEQHQGCDTSRWFGHVERYTGRSVSNAHQNREYPKRILLQYQPSYRSWGGYVSCAVR